MKPADVLVISFKDGWEVRRHGHRAAASRFRTQRSALKFARELAAESGARMVIHAFDGTVLTEQPTFVAQPTMS